MISLLIALVLAWCLVLGKGYKFPPLVAIFTDNQKLLSAHLDYLMMTMLLLGFNATRVPLASYVVWIMAIGSIGNPTVFLAGSTQHADTLRTDRLGAPLDNRRAGFPGDHDGGSIERIGSRA